MYKAVLLAIFLTLSIGLFSQSVYPYQELRLEKPSDFKETEPMALSASLFLLGTPYKKNDPDRTHAFDFLVKWTAGDKDYNFGLTGVIRDLVQEKELMTLCIPAMVKFCLENKTLANSPGLIEKSAVKTVLDYCDNPANNFTLKKKFRKQLESN